MKIMLFWDHERIVLSVYKQLKERVSSSTVDISFAILQNVKNTFKICIFSNILSKYLLFWKNSKNVNFDSIFENLVFWYKVQC